MRFIAVSFALSGVLAASLQAAPPSAEAVELRNLGIALLENEKELEAADTFRKLATLVPEDPLPWANLAVALLRTSKTDEAKEAIAKALSIAPERADLIGIDAEIMQWSGELEASVGRWAEAASLAPRDVELQYKLWDTASSASSETAREHLETAIERLADLRPENPLVLLQLGEIALRNGDAKRATRAYKRLRELTWVDPETSAQADRMFDLIFPLLETGDLDKAIRPARGLGNIFNAPPRSNTTRADLTPPIQGIPVDRFVDEPPPTDFGNPLEVSFKLGKLADGATSGRALAVADFDGDHMPDTARILAGNEPQLEVRLASGKRQLLAGQSHHGLLSIDLDNDGHLDLIGFGAPGDDAAMQGWSGAASGTMTDATETFGIGKVNATAIAAVDFDAEGDLDLLVAKRGSDLELLRNNLAGPLESVGEKSLPPLRDRSVTDIHASDLDLDGDLDVLVAHEGGVTWLQNLRQGRFGNETAIGGLRQRPAASALVTADLDDDGRIDILSVGSGVDFMRSLGRRFEPAASEGLDVKGGQDAVAADFDNDGVLDLAVAEARGVSVFLRRGPKYEKLEVALKAATLEAADIDRDGDLDIVATGPEGLHLLTNEGGNQNHWLRVRLRGLDADNQKNNHFGRGALVEVKKGRARQVREANSDELHFGVGRFREVDLLRVVWNNGVPQNRLEPKADQEIVEEQLLKGSCPFLYTWNGEEVVFVTDLLWGAPLGMPLADGVWNVFDPEELVRIDGAALRDGRWDLRITEELWETAYFDRVRLWVVDHPKDVEVASSLRIVPGASGDHPALVDRVLGTRAVRPVAQAVDGQGRDVTARVARRDDIYADGYPSGRYQGVTPAPWSVEFDLGEAPVAPVRLLLDGWVFPADASLNIATSQRTDLNWTFTRLEALTEDGWQTLLDPMGFPAGKTKTMVVDTPALPAGTTRLRIVSSRWLHWDRIAWSLEPADDAPVVAARLSPDTAELGYRGFSKLVQSAPNAPHTFEYSQVSEASPWLSIGGAATRYGDVSPLLTDVEDEMVVLKPGDEMRLTFDAGKVAPVAHGYRRTLFLESHGYDKDADRNTWEADSTEPFPFRGMTSYPLPEGEAWPDDARYRRYLEEWQTRDDG